MSNVYVNGLNEKTFLLTEGDPASTAAINAWINYRLEHGHNRAEDEEIVEAVECATVMTERYVEYYKFRRVKGNREGEY